MLDYEFDFNDRKTQFVFLLIIIIFIVIVYNIFNQEENTQIEIVEPIKINIEKKTEEPIFKEISIKQDKATFESKIEKKEKKIKVSEENTKVFDEKIKEKEITLFSSNDSSGRYTIKLISNLEIIIENKHSTRYVPIIGKIEDNSNTGIFSISLNEDYIDYVNDSKLIIIDITNKKRKLECSGSFLYSVNIDTRYNIKLDVNEDFMSCYISSEERLPDFIIEELGKNQNSIMINLDEHNKSLDHSLIDKE